MSKVPSVDYDKIIKALTNIGYKVTHQKGSHTIMRLTENRNQLFGCRNNDFMVVIPAHKPLGRRMLGTVIKEVDFSVEEFNKLL